MKAVVLAGGFATRLWPLSERRAKPLLPIAGKEIVSHLVEKLPKDIEIIISTNEQFEKPFKDWKRAKFPKRNIKILVEPVATEGEKKGAIGGISYAISECKIDDDLVVLAGDNLFTFDLAHFVSEYKGNALVAVYDIESREKAKKFGVVHIQNNKIVEFEEKPQKPKSSIVSTLCYILPKESLPYLKEFAKKGKDNAGDFIAYLVKNSPFDVEPYIFSGSWFDVGSFEAYLEANKKIQETPIIDKSAKVEKSQISGASLVGKDTKIINSKIEDSVIMEGCKIENCTIKDSVIDFDSSIKNAKLEKQLIRNNTII